MLFISSVSKPKGIAFVPNATFIEKIITSKLSATEFKNEYYDYIESYDSTNSLTYNEKTKEHDIPEYSAEVVCKYKGAKICLDGEIYWVNEVVFSQKPQKGVFKSIKLETGIYLNIKSGAKEDWLFCRGSLLL